MNKLTNLYKEIYGTEPDKIEQIAKAGSNRSYVRLFAKEGIEPRTVIGVIGQDKEENASFIYLTRHFNLRRLSVPQIIAVGGDGMRYLQTDLGSVSLYSALENGRKNGRYNLEERELLHRTITALPEFQVRGARELDFGRCYPQQEFDRTGVLFDLNYFKYCFLKAVDMDYHELKLEADFQLFAKDLTQEKSETFLYRDFQSRNVMISPDGLPCFIDYQGGRRGPLQYDLASFLWQASAKYPSSLRQELINAYIDSLKLYIDVKESDFRRSIPLFVLFRLLQVLGTYGFRGLYEKKQYFIDSIPAALDNIRELLAAGACPYPYLRSLLERLIALPAFRLSNSRKTEREDGYKTAQTNVFEAHPSDGPATFSKYDGNGTLVVRVFSFSFRNGIPDDTSGNGGGYVFDCRSTHNPGRYEPYKKLTGLDEPVVRFLEDDGEILKFLESVYTLADAHVERYMQRGFTDLMFSFGCTGGQHRSVYSAQHLAERLNRKYGIEVQVCHREQGIEQVIKAVEVKR